MVNWRQQEKYTMSELFLTLDLLRKKKGISLKNMGEICGISPQGVQKWKQTNRIPLEHVTTLAGYFGVSIDFLLNGSGPPKTAPQNDKEGARDRISHTMAGVLEKMPEKVAGLVHQVETLTTTMTILSERVSSLEQAMVRLTGKTKEVL